MNKENNYKQLVIISGASRGIGKYFLEHYSILENNKTIGISRTKNNPIITSLDLYDANATRQFIENTPLEGIEKTIFIHSIGIDKFEPYGTPNIDKDNDGIDDEVYATNVTTFMNIAKPLIEETSKINIPLNIVNIGSISDRYNVPFWQSFSKSKNIVRNYVKADNHKNVRGMFLNVSTVLADNEMYARKLADTTYWLPVENLIKNAVPYIDNFNNKNIKFMELDFFNHSPEYTSDYFTNLPKLYRTWQRDMGFNNKAIPEGIRI